MKKTITILFLFMPLFIFAKEIPFYPKAIYSPLDYIEYQYEQSAYADPYTNPLIIPIGWSPEGVFAYIVEHNYEGPGAGPIFEWIIQNMITDEILWSSPINIEEWLENHEGTLSYLSRQQAFDTDFMTVVEDYSIKLKNWNIENSQDLILSPLPYSWDNHSYQSILEREEGSYFGMEGFITSYTLLLERDRESSKTVSTLSGSPILNVQIAGVFKSPYEDRIALVVCETVRGWEGPPNPLRIKMVGAHLNYGF